MPSAAARTRADFIRWQCALRKRAMREGGGRPTPGMRPRAIAPEGSEIAPAITVLLLRKAPAASTDQFRHIVRRTPDARERYEAGLRVLSAAYYQDPADFSDTMTALFAADSPVARTLSSRRRCVLEFNEAPRRVRLACAVRELDPGEDCFEATLWHNRLFNPDPPPAVRILAFRPFWNRRRG
jgi:hypothetical protein